MTVRIERQDLPALELPPEVEETLTDEVTTKYVTIAAVAFMDDNKWRLKDGAHTFYATINDAEFLAKVDTGEAFRKGDMLGCEIRAVRLRTGDGDGLRVEYSVERVLEHLPRAVQMRLGRPDPDGP